MRIRISAEEPRLKAWFIVESVSNILQLKRAMCKDVHALHDLGIDEPELELLLDDFELLDESSVDVLREGDLICLKVTRSAKRKAAIDTVATNKKRRISPKSPPPPPITVRDTSDSESSSASSTTSSSSSDTSSSSGSDADSDSTSSSDASPPRPQAILRRPPEKLPQPATTMPPPAAAITHTPDSHDFTPPGYGKPQTIKRNERRRRKRMHELQRGAAATSEEAAAPVGVSTSNATPLGDREVSTPPPAAPLSSGNAGSSRGTTSYMMSSLSNKNKRRGYKEAPDVLPPKIIFGDAEPEQAPGSLPGSTGSVLPNHLPRLIPPSERQDRGDIPESWKLFVTSIDVEDGMPRRGKKRKQKQAQQWDSQPGEGDDMEVVTALDYGGPEVDVVVPAGVVTHASTDVSSLDWHGIEQRLPGLALVDSPLLLKSGITVAWKSLDINPATFTPEFLLHVAEVLRLEDANNVVIKRLHQPGARPIAFGSLDEEEMEVDSEEVVAWDTIIAEGWRITR